MTVTPPRRRRRLAAALVAAVLVGFPAAGCGQGGNDSPGFETVSSVSSVDFDYVIPAGTGARLDRGERLTLLPARIDARVGQVIRIVNQDERGHLLGPFFVGAGETMTQRFTRPGELVGACAVHPDGQLVVSVTA